MFFCNDFNAHWFILQAKTTTFVMFRHFKLIWAATLMLQCRCSPQVALQCFEESAPPAINCTIETSRQCTGYEYMWMDSKNNIICNSGDSNYECNWDNQTFVSRVLPKGAKCETYKVSIETSCGFAHSDISLTHCNNGELFFGFVSIVVKESSLNTIIVLSKVHDPTFLQPTDNQTFLWWKSLLWSSPFSLFILIWLFLCKIMTNNGIFKGFTKERIPRCFSHLRHAL